MSESEPSGREPTRSPAPEAPRRSGATPNAAPVEGESLLAPLFTDPSLRGLLVAGGGILVTFGAWMISLAVGSRSLPAIGALLLVVLLSAEAVRLDVRKAGRPGLGTWMIVAFWLLSGALAWAAIRYGLF